MSTICRFALLALGLIPVTALTAFSQIPKPTEVDINYTYVHTNAPPSGCGCFSMQGAYGAMVFDLPHNFAIVGEVGVLHGANILGSSKDLTLLTYAAGPRYRWFVRRHVTPFAQSLFGAGHSSGSFSPDALGLGGRNAFVMTLGGGVNVDLNRRVSLQALQADYFLTHFPNGINDHQNNLRLGAGLTFSLRATQGIGY